MKLVLIVGDGAVGKMTVGQELMKITGLRLFHNHMTIEPVLEIFNDFNVDVILKLRYLIFEEFVKTNNYGMIYTCMWAYDCPEDWEIMTKILGIFESAGAKLYCVELTAPLDVRLKRNVTENRLKNKASKRDIASSNERVIQHTKNHRFVSRDGEVPIKNFMRIDNSNIEPDVVAKMIKDKPCDADTILGWIKDENAFRKWSTDRYPHYPITADDMNYKYMDCNGDCVESDNFYPMTAFDDGGIVGHLIMRFTDAEKSTLRFGFVIVDDSKRGIGYGKQMLRLALRFAFDILKVQKVTLGVLENNPGAYHCYKAAGFKDAPMEKTEYYHLMGEDVKCLELEAII